MFSGLIVAATVLATLPHLNAAPYSDAFLKRLATAIGNQGQSCAPYGISTVGCPQDMLQLNPVLIDLQTYGSEFGVVVDCSAGSELCTDLTIHLDRLTLHAVVCSESAQSQGTV